MQQKSKHSSGEGDRISADRLRTFVAAVYQRHGVAEPDAVFAADTLVQADLWGHQSHGCLRLAWYRARLMSGAINVGGKPETLVDAGAIGVIDGKDSLGPTVARFATLDAVERAQKHGVGAVAVRNSNHFGTCMYYTRMGAERDCVMLLTTNGGPNMAPWGGRKKMIGTNPWSVAAPAGNYPPMIMDVANSGVARGKIFLAQERGEPIPDNWALDASGCPTTDPKAALEGLILPMAGHKGYAIGVIVDMLSGVLTGSAFLDDVHGPYDPVNRSGAGHFVIALNIAAFQPVSSFEAKMETYIERLKSVPLADGVTEVFYPGEIEANNAKRHTVDGLLLPRDTVSQLLRIAREDGIQAPI